LNLVGTLKGPTQKALGKMGEKIRKKLNFYTSSLFLN